MDANHHAAKFNLPLKLLFWYTSPVQQCTYPLARSLQLKFIAGDFHACSSQQGPRVPVLYSRAQVGAQDAAPSPATLDPTIAFNSRKNSVEKFHKP
jgi:hypothetical protein